MKVIHYSRYGSPAELQLKEVEKPAPKAGEVLVKIHAASVNSWDCDLVKGKPFLVRIIGGIFKPTHKILGADIAGIVESCGPDAKDFQPGDAVFGDIAGSGFGGFAEYVSVPEKLLAKKSPGMSFEQAAALPQAWFLAIQGLRYGVPLKKGQQILINGAGGGVGTLGLQYARYCGAEVTCVDRPEKFEVLRSLGAKQCIDFTKEDYTKNGIQYDLILDVIAHRKIADYKRALKPGGTFAMIGGSMGGLLFSLMLFGSLISKMAGKKLGIMGYRPNRAELMELNTLFETGAVVPVIDGVYPLKETPAAIQRLMDGAAIGKIVIKITD